MLNNIINTVIVAIGVAVLLGCNKQPEPGIGVSLHSKQNFIEDIMDSHDPITTDDNSSQDSSKVMNGNNAMYLILSKLKNKHKKVAKGKRFILLKKKNNSTATSRLNVKIKENVVINTVSKIIRPLQSRYCTKVIFLKTLRRKILVKCILLTQKPKLLNRARLKITSLNKLFLNPKNKECVNSKVMKYMNNRINLEKKCLDDIDSVYQIVSPVAIIQK